jgi:hypothetical protein
MWQIWKKIPQKILCKSCIATTPPFFFLKIFEISDNTKLSKKQEKQSLNYVIT